MKKRTRVYIDGNNLYYGLLKDTPWKWLDLPAFVAELVGPDHEIVAVNYFTAPIKTYPYDPAAIERQNVYSQALSTLPVKTTLGFYSKNAVVMPAYEQACKECQQTNDGKRSPFNGINPMVRIAVLYGCVSLGGIAYRAKTTLKLHRDPLQPTTAYSYEISNIEVLTGTARIVILPNVKTSIDPKVLRGTAESLTQPSCKILMDVGILLNGVCDVNGVPLLAVRK